MQWEPVAGSPLHVDLLGVKLTEKIAVDLPIQLVGTAIGVKQNGGLLQHLLRDLEVEGLPLDIPEYLEVDINDLDIGDGVRVSDLSLDKLTILTDPSQSIVIVSAPKAVEEPVEEEEEVEGEGEAEEAEEEAAE
jgi:large subunit ribosomal protein L25